MHDASKTEVLWCASARRQSQLPSDPLAVGSDLVLPVSCVRDLGFHWRWPDDAYPSHSDMFEVFCCPSTIMKHTSICVKRHDAVAHHGAGVFQAWLWLLPAFRSNSWTGFSLCKTLLHGWSPKLVVSCYCADYTGFRCQNVFRSSWQCWCIAATWLPGLRSSARVTPQRTSTTALFDYISTGRSTHCAFYHWRPHLSSDCCISLEQFVGVGPVISVIASFPQQTENRTFCPVLQSWLTTSHCTEYYYVTSLFKLIVMCPSSLRT